MSQKKRITNIIIVLCIALLGGVIVKLIRDSDKERNPYKDEDYISYDEMFNKNGHFYVYFYKDNCKFCKNIQQDILTFSKNNEVYFVNTEDADYLKDYDWDNHSIVYDVEIGEKNENGEIRFYDFKDRSDIEASYPYLYYEILLPDEDYLNFHPEKEKDKVYAICTHPKLDKESLTKSNFVVPAVPMLVEFNNRTVINYYFDDKEIIDFLNINKKPTNDYWNIDE